MMNPTAEQPKPAGLRELGKEALAKLKSLMSTGKDREVTKAKTFEDLTGERDALHRVLLDAGKITMASFFRINDLLTAKYKNPEMSVKAAVEIYQLGLKHSGSLDEEGWAKITTDWIDAHTPDKK